MSENVKRVGSTDVCTQCLRENHNQAACPHERFFLELAASQGHQLRGHAFDYWLLDEASWIRNYILTGDYNFPIQPGISHGQLHDCPLHGPQSHCHGDHGIRCAKCWDLAGQPECMCPDCSANRSSWLGHALALVKGSVWREPGTNKFWLLEDPEGDRMYFVGPASKYNRDCWCLLAKYATREEALRTLCPMKEGDDPWSGLP